MKLKQLNETVGALKKEIRTYLDSEERKKMTAEQRAADPKLKELEARYDAAAADLDAEVRQVARESSKPIELSKGERRDVARFDFRSLLQHMDALRTGRHSRLDGVEAELVEEGIKEARAAGVNVTGIPLPSIITRTNGIERRDLSVTGGTTTQYGGTLVATEKVGLLDDFYKRSVMIQGGAMVLNGLVGNVDLPRYTKAPNPSKKAENAAADELSPTFTSLSLSPKRLAAVIDISDQLLLQSSAALETFLRAALARQLGEVQEIAFWHGGGTNEPVGVAATSGIGSVVGGTNGAAPDWTDIVDLETEVAIDDADVGALHYVTNAKVRGKLKKTAKVSSTDSVMIWGDNGLNGYVPLVTNAVSSTLTKGSATGVCSAIFFGNLRDFVVGYWGGLMLEMVTDKTLRTQGQRALVANLYYDAGVLRAKSFSAMLDALTS